MNKSNGAPRTFEVAKSTVSTCWRATRTSIEVGSMFTSPAKEPTIVSDRSPFVTVRRSRMALNRSTGSTMPAGTNTRAGVNALPPIDRSLRVDTGIEMRNSSTSTPFAR